MAIKTVLHLKPAATGPRFSALPHEDYTEVLAVLYGYGRFYDDDRLDEFMDLLADDAAFYPNWPGVAPEELHGKAALSEFFHGARAYCTANGIQPRHAPSAPIVTATGADFADAGLNMFYAEWSKAGGTVLKMVGQYDFQLRKQNGRWRIARWSMRYDM